MPVDDGVDHRLDRVVVPDVAGVKFVGQAFDLAPGAGDDGRTLPGENAADAGANPSNTAGHQHDPAGEPEAESGAFVGMSHCAQRTKQVLA